MIMKLFSSAFTDGGRIPVRYTCDGENISPPLSWSELPEETATLALICDDPDAPAGVWDHWLLFNIKADVPELEEGISHAFDPFPGSGHGLNSWGKACYGGPCPPSGEHRYFFTLYALSGRVNLKPGATKAHLMRAMEPLILGTARLTGRYTSK